MGRARSSARPRLSGREGNWHPARKASPGFLCGGSVTLSPVHHLLKIVSLDSCIVALSRARHQSVGRHDCAVKPVHLTASTNAADNADIRSVDFGNNVGNEVLRQSKSVRHFRRHLQKAHDATPGSRNASDSESCALSSIRHKTQSRRNTHNYVAVKPRSVFAFRPSYSRNRAYRVSNRHTCLSLI